jgi:cell division protein FtsB
MMRRRTMRAAISLAEAPKPSDPSGIETQAVQAIEVRPKLQAAIEEQKHKLEEAELELAKTFASATQTAARLDPEFALQKHKALEELKERIKLRSEALVKILELVSKHLEQLKVDFPAAVYAALIQRVDKLEEERLAKKTAGEGFAEEIKKLKYEISKLPKGDVKKAAVNY